MGTIMCAIFIASCISIGVSIGAGISFWSVEIPLVIISSLLAFFYERKLSKEIEKLKNRIDKDKK